METSLFLELSQHWLNEKFLTVKTGQKVSGVLQSLGTQFCHFIVVQDRSDAFTALLMTVDFLTWFEELKRSRFPGDLEPGQLRMRETLKVFQPRDFYIVDGCASRVQLDPWFKGLPARNVLLTHAEGVIGVIAEEHFGDWLDRLREHEPKPPAVDKSGVKSFLRN